MSVEPLYRAGTGGSRSDSNRPPIRVGTSRGLPRLTRAAQQRGDLILQLGVPFLSLLLEAEERRYEIQESAHLTRAEKRLELAAVFYGRFDAANGLRSRVWELFPGARAGQLDPATVRALARAEDLIADAVFGRQLWAPTRPRCGGASQFTWSDLVALEPRLRGMLRDARAGLYGEFPSCWHGGGLRGNLSRLLGWNRANGDHPILSTADAFDLAAEVLLAACPDGSDRAAEPDRATPRTTRRGRSRLSVKES